MPRSKARIAGAFYLGTVITGLFAMIAGTKLVVQSDAAATAANILSHKTLFQLGFTNSLLAGACYLVVTALFYQLFKPAGSSVSLTAALFSVVGVGMGAVSSFLQLAPLAILADTPYLRVFNAQQLQSLSLLFLKLGTRASYISLMFFGFYCLLIGYLILKSNFLPRFVGVLMLIAGLGWMTFISPPLGSALFPYNVLPGLVGELALTISLLVMGVNVQRWNAMAARA